VKRYSALISIAARNRLERYGFRPSSQEAEEIRQEVLLSIWKGEKLKTVINRRNILYWLAILSGNAAISYMRRARPREIMSSAYGEIAEKNLAELAPSSRHNPLDELMRAELDRKIRSAIEALPAKERLIIKLNFFYNKGYAEISKMLNIPIGTVSSYLKRSKEKLAAVLKDFR
jgi:RNA polymerase sigma-70 factor (ECF subfamily)